MLRFPPVASPAWLPLTALVLLCCQGTIGDGGPDLHGPDANAMSYQPPVLPRLTNQQYQHALEDLLGPDLPQMPLEPDTNPYLFYSIGASTTSISELGVQQLEESADAVATAVFSDAVRREALVGCVPVSASDECVTSFIDRFGRRAYRRPLDDAEHARWLSVAANLSQGDPWLGLQLVVTGMLQSPNFVYRVELGEPAGDGRLRYTAWEMASRLSFTLWNTIPDDELLDAAEQGDLLTVEGIAAQAERLLADERARQTVQDFFAQYFDLSRLDGLSRNPDTYPLFSDTMPESMRTEVRLLVDDFVNRRDDDVRQLFSTRRTFVNTELAALYGVEAEGASAVAFVPVELPEDGPRAGLLTFGAFLAMNAHETETSPTLRGKYLRERVLCQDVPPPPDDVNVDLTPKPGDPPKTLRERLEQHRDDPACASCHAFIDPPGFLFENFDSVGAYRTHESGYPVDATGDIDGVPLENARELADLLADDERVGQCMVKQLYRHVQGRLDADGEEPALEQLDAQFAADGYRFRKLLVALVSHDSFRFVAPEEVAP